MKSGKLLYILTALLLIFSGAYTAESYAASKKSKAKTTQSTSKSSKSSKSSSKSKQSSKSSKSKQSTKSSKSTKSAKSTKSTKSSSVKQTQSRKSNSYNYYNSNKRNNGKTGYSTTRKKTYNNYSGTKRSYQPKDNKYPVPEPEVAQNDSLTLSVNSAVQKWAANRSGASGLRVNSVKPDHAKQSTRVGLNENFTYIPLDKEFIDDLHKVVKKNLPDSIRDYKLALQVGDKDLSYYISRIDKLPEKDRANIPFVYPTDPYGNYTKGMAGDKIALWGSHGKYYTPKGGGWGYQRELLFETLEDLSTSEYIIPFLAPMLENAGAYVFMPRERDVNLHEVIVDNDTNKDGEIFSQSTYRETNGTNKWEIGEGEGFIYDLENFRDTENPFENGTYRQTKTIRGGKESTAAWYADIPEPGEYAVYISYETLPDDASTTDALYTVNYSGGSRQFRVNQQMGGGTWIYLGTFPLEEGYSDNVPVVTLSNLSSKSDGKYVTADAVKIGGGMGNIERSPYRRDIYYDPSTPDNSVAETDEEVNEEDEESSENTENTESTENPQPAKKGYAPTFRTSGMPRFVEGARYWMQWAGVPESVYSPYHGSDDYKDDYTSRGHWVNWLAGGSRVLPDRDGLRIPIDLSLAFHTDAGKRADDSIIGTLGIYYTMGGRRYEDGTPRIDSRILTDMVMTQLTADIRQTYEPKWTRRSMWDKSYLEARVAEVPTMLLELLSHENFGDVQYGHDPNFRFLASRAIYKAMARFLAQRKDRDVVIQPLPVHDFAISRMAAGKYKLSWKATPDKLEPTAMPDKYIILERSQGTMGFKKVGETKSTSFDITIKGHDIHSFRVIAVNAGGSSFPSETLALREAMSNKPTVLIINGFDRLSAPGTINQDGRAGFNSREDFGVPYMHSMSFAGYQKEFRRSAGSRHGDSDSNYVGKVIAGNTFDYPALHGAAIADAGYGFVSTSAGAIENGSYDMSKYKIVDLILGKQKQTTVGKGYSGVRYKAFPEALQKKLTEYTKKGGNLFVSGQYVASDLTTDSDKAFGRNVLGIELAEKESLRNDRVKVIPTQMTTGMNENKYAFNNDLNSRMYIVENPDAIQPDFDKDAEILMQFDDTESGAAVALKDGKRRAITMSVPFETIRESGARKTLMRQILDFLSK